MIHEVIVEGFVLQVDVTHCENNPPQPDNRDSDWDCMGTRELEYTLLSGITYDGDGIRMDVPVYVLPVLAHQYGPQITLALWVEIDASTRRQRWAA